MLKFYAAVAAALHTAHLFAHVGAAAGTLALIAYVVACAAIDAIGTLLRRVDRRPTGTRSAA